MPSWRWLPFSRVPKLAFSPTHSAEKEREREREREERTRLSLRARERHGSGEIARVGAGVGGGGGGRGARPGGVGGGRGGERGAACAPQVPGPPAHAGRDEIARRPPPRPAPLRRRSPPRRQGHSHRCRPLLCENWNWDSPKDYYVQVDTGSDILWINCIGCDQCPKKSNLGVELTLYNPNGSSTAERITCDQEFCTSTYNAAFPGCKPDVLCPYNLTYGDGSSTAGYFVEDNVILNQVTGNLQASSMNSSVIFGCAAKQSGGLGTSSEALDGIIGFGQANSSMLSQLASSGKVKKVFAHCLDNTNGGGIFAIGEVVQPKVKTTPLVPNQAHYNVVMKAVEVGGHVTELPTDIFGFGGENEAIIDSGTTLAYLPGDIYNPLIEKIMAQQPGLDLHTVEEQFSCFKFVGSVDNGFPVVKFHFDSSLALAVYPHDYLFRYHDDTWCIGFMSAEMQSKDGKDITLLGDLVFSNKLVLYDLENQTIGWADYNCSSRIMVKDEKSGATYTVGAHNLGSTSELVSPSIAAVLLLLVAVLYNFML